MTISFTGGAFFRTFHADVFGHSLLSYHLRPLREAYLVPSRASKIELFASNDYQPLTIFAKSSMSGVRLGSKYASDCYIKSKGAFKD